MVPRLVQIILRVQSSIHYTNKSFLDPGEHLDIPDARLLIEESGAG
jgi:hypothetical protein